MEIQVFTYDGMDKRLEVVKNLLVTLQSAGFTVQLVHCSIATARLMGSQLGESVMSSYDLQFTNVEADCFLVVDADIVAPKTVRRIESFGKRVYAVVPKEALSSVRDNKTTLNFKDKHDRVEIIPRLMDDDNMPRTAACHHFADTCMSCEGLVLNWMADRRDRAAGEGS